MHFLVRVTILIYCPNWDSFQSERALLLTMHKRYKLKLSASLRHVVTLLLAHGINWKKIDQSQLSFRGNNMDKNPTSLAYKPLTLKTMRMQPKLQGQKVGNKGYIASKEDIFPNVDMS